jgi:hypothetical protein
MEKELLSLSDNLSLLAQGQRGKLVKGEAQHMQLQTFSLCFKNTVL